MHDIYTRICAVTHIPISSPTFAQMRLQVGGGAAFRLDRVPSTSLGHTTPSQVKHLLLCHSGELLRPLGVAELNLGVFKLLVAWPIPQPELRAMVRWPGYTFCGEEPTAIFSVVVCKSRRLTADSRSCDVVFALFGFTLPREGVRVMACGRLRLISISLATGHQSVRHDIFWIVI